MSTIGARNASRMTAEQRKQAIVRAAASVIAQAGVRGASVRGIAEAAGVSEALLYKHFPSKQALYAETLAVARESSKFTIDRFATLTPSTESFVLLTYATIRFTLFGFPGRGANEEGTARLLFQSLLDDGSLARTVLGDTAANWMEYVLASYEAAIDEGDVAELPIEAEHRFRFVQQLGMALRLSHLPDPPAFAYSGTKHRLADQAALFSLRGVGVTSEAIHKYFKPEKLQAILDSLFPQSE